MSASTIDPVVVSATQLATDRAADVVGIVGGDVYSSSLKVTGELSFIKAIVFFFIALVLSAILVGFNWIIISRRHNNKKNSPYECGFEPLGSPVADFEPNFIGVGIAFLIYDVEILLTYPWAMGLRGQPFSALFIFMLFILFLMLSYAYEVADGSFDL